MVDVTSWVMGSRKTMPLECTLSTASTFKFATCCVEYTTKGLTNSWGFNKPGQLLTRSTLESMVIRSHVTSFKKPSTPSPNLALLFPTKSFACKNATVASLAVLSVSFGDFLALYFRPCLRPSSGLFYFLTQCSFLVIGGEYGASAAFGPGGTLLPVASAPGGKFNSMFSMLLYKPCQNCSLLGVDGGWPLAGSAQSCCLGFRLLPGWC